MERIHPEWMLETGKLSDFTIICKGTEIRVHKFVLYNQSSYFSALFDSNMEEARQGAVTFDDVDPKLMKHLIKFFYGGNWCFDFKSCNLKTSVNVWILAGRLQARRAMREIEMRLSDYFKVYKHKKAAALGDLLSMVFSHPACAKSAIGEVFAEAAWDIFTNRDDMECTAKVISSFTRHHQLAEKMLLWCGQYTKYGVTVKRSRNAPFDDEKAEAVRETTLMHYFTNALLPLKPVTGSH